MIQDLAFGRLENEFRPLQPYPEATVVCFQGTKSLVSRDEQGVITLPTYEQVCAWGRKIAAMSMDARRHVEGLMPHRADIIPSGIAILEAAMVSFSMPELVLSAHGNMDGYLKQKFSKKC